MSLRLTSAVLAGGIFLVSACASAPPAPDAAPVALGTAFSEGLQEVAFDTEWWTRFDDPQMGSLIARALAANKSLDVAQANIRLAGSLARSARLNRSYGTSSSAGANVGRSTGAGQDVEASATGNIGASWEMDLFGRIDAEIAAAEFSVQEARQLRRDVAVIVASDTALAYVTLRSAQARLHVARKNARTQLEGLDLLQSLFANGRATRLDLERADTQYRTTLASIPRLEASIQTSLNALAALTGQPATDPDEELGRLVLETDDIPEHQGAILTGSVESLTRRRPDIRAAEAALGRQMALGEAARAELFPTIVWNADVFALFNPDNSVGDLSSLGFGIGPAIQWAGPDLRRVRANIDASDARTEAAIAQYEVTVLAALSEVESALTQYVSELRRRDDLESAATSARRSLELARLRFEEGVDDYLDVLDAQRTLLDAEDRLAESRQQTSEAAIAAYRALGGISEDADDISSEPN